MTGHSDAQEYARSLADTLARFDAALGGDVDAVRAVVAEYRGDSVELSGDDAADVVAAALTEWPLEVSTVWSHADRRPQLTAVVLLLAMNGPTAEVRLPIGGEQAEVRVWDGGTQGFAYPLAVRVADWFAAFFEDGDAWAVAR